LRKARDIIEGRYELTLLDDDLAKREPALAQHASAAVSARLPAGTPHALGIDFTTPVAEESIQSGQGLCLPDVGKRLDEESLLARLHDLAGSDPPLSLKLAREALARFPNTPNAPEFQWNVVKALYDMGHGDEALNEARTMVEKYPGNSFTGDIEHHLLHPQPNQSEPSNP